MLVFACKSAFKVLCETFIFIKKKNFYMSHGVWKSHKKSPFTTLRAKWATLTYWIKMTNLATFRKTEVCGKTVLPDKSISIGQKLVESAKTEKQKLPAKKCYYIVQKLDQNWWKMPKLKNSNETFLDDFQTMCFLLPHSFSWVKKCFLICIVLMSIKAIVPSIDPVTT